MDQDTGSRTKEGGGVHLAVLHEGDFFGEMAILEREVRSTSVRALGEDPSLAYRILQKMSRRIRELDTELDRVNSELK